MARGEACAKRLQDHVKAKIAPEQITALVEIRDRAAPDPDRQDPALQAEVLVTSSQEVRRSGGSVSILSAEDADHADWNRAATSGGAATPRQMRNGLDETRATEDKGLAFRSIGFAQDRPLRGRRWDVRHATISGLLTFWSPSSKVFRWKTCSFFGVEGRRRSKYCQPQVLAREKLKKIETARFVLWQRACSRHRQTLRS